MTSIISNIFFFVTMFGRIIAYNLKLPVNLTFHSPHKNEKWFIKLKDYPGPIEHLEMVSGADKLCQDIFDDMMIDPYEHPHEFNLTVSNKFTERGIGSYKLKKMPSKLPYYSGRFYEAYEWDINKSTWTIKRIIWLCPVTMYVFGRYPEKVYLNLK